jgi:hypothetical protein
MSVRSSTDDEIALTLALSPFDKAQGRRWNGREKFLARARLVRESGGEGSVSAQRRTSK